MRAFDRRHADRLAAHFAAFGGPAIVLAPDHNAQRAGFRVETQYGHVLPEEMAALLSGSLISRESKRELDGPHHSRSRVRRGVGAAVALRPLPWLR